MSKTAKKIDPILIRDMKQNLGDPNYITNAVNGIAMILALKLFISDEV